jgi:low temperature requirement protein LtrA
MQPIGLLKTVITVTYGRDSSRRRLWTRRIALILCLLFIAASLLSSAFILTHASHVHDHAGEGGSCATCAHVMAAGHLLRTIGLTVVAAALSFGAHRAFISILKFTAADLDFLISLVSLKVRLNN